MNRRYIIRDSDTKKHLIINRIKMEFNSPNSAIMHIKGMNFNLGNFYEIYDTVKNVVINKK